MKSEVNTSVRFFSKDQVSKVLDGYLWSTVCSHVCNWESRGTAFTHTKKYNNNLNTVLRFLSWDLYIVYRCLCLCLICICIRLSVYFRVMCLNNPLVLFSLRLTREHQIMKYRNWLYRDNMDSHNQISDIGTRTWLFLLMHNIVTGF